MEFAESDSELRDLYGAPSELAARKSLSQLALGYGGMTLTGFRARHNFPPLPCRSAFWPNSFPV